MIIDIPQYDTLNLKYLVLDYNGTIATDGLLDEKTKEQLKLLANHLEIFVLTADTNGTVKKECANLPVTVKVFDSNGAMQHKSDIVASLGNEN